MTLDFSQVAIRDLQAIDEYTEQQWGTRQSRRYVLQFRSALLAIQSGRERGRPFHLPNRTLRRTLSGKHHIYFERLDGLIFISRVLHGAMNVYLLEFPPAPLLGQSE